MLSNVLIVLQLQELNLPLNASSWSKDELKDPKKLQEMTLLLNAQREIAEKVLDAQWEAKWRQNKVGHSGSFSGFKSCVMLYVSSMYCHNVSFAVAAS